MYFIITQPTCQVKKGLFKKSETEKKQGLGEITWRRLPQEIIYFWLDSNLFLNTLIKIAKKRDI